MNAIATVTSGLNAALRLAWGRVDGIPLVLGDRTTVVRSFWAILFCVPSVICRLLMYWAEEGVPEHAGHLAARELIVFALGWLIFVEVSFRLAPMLGRPDRWGRFVTLWNWCNVVEGILIVVGGVPGLLGAPPIVDQAFELVMIGWALWLEWYAIRLGFGVTIAAAIWLVILDQAIGITLGSIAMALGP
jgi:hypothetical protein